MLVLLYALVGVQVVLYVLCTLLGLQNLRVFVISQQRFKNYFVTSFYILSLTTLFARMAQ